MPAQRSLIRPETSVSHSSVIVSLSLLFTALLGAGQALLVVFIVGEGDRTDAFLAAYSLYVVFAIFGGSLRASLVPLIGPSDSEEALRRRANELLARVLLVGVVAMLILALISPPAGQLLTHGLPADARWTAVLSLIVLAPAAFLQIYAAAQSAVLNAAKRFTFTSCLYVAYGVVALAFSAVLLEAIGILGAAFGLLAGAVALSAGHSAYLGAVGIRPRPRRSWLRDREQGRLAISLVAGAALGIALQINLAISLSAVSEDPGAITTYTYAFFMVSLMLTITSVPLGLVTLPDLVDRIAARGRATAEEHLLRVAPYAFAVLAPLLLAYAADGKPLLEAIFSGSLSDESIDQLYDLGLALGAMAIPTTFLFLTGPVALALGRSRQYLAIGAIGVAIQAAIVTPLSTLGPVPVACGHGAASVIITALLVSRTFGPGWLRLVASALRRSLPAFGLASVFLLLRWPLGSDPSAVAASVSALAGLGIYVGLAVVFWPRVSAAFVDLLRHPRRIA